MSNTYSTKEVLEEVKEHLKEIKADVKDTQGKVGIQNGRVTKIEGWSNEVKIILENHTKVISSLKTSRTKIITIISVILVGGGFIIKLILNSIDNKISNGIETALSDRVFEEQ